jgi:peptidoglycan-associated lipoprotein
MKIINYLLVFVISFVLVESTVYAQKNSKEEIKGDEAYEIGEYAAAIDHYKKAYAKEKNNARKVDMVFKIGKCYAAKNEPKSAELWFRKAIMVKYPDPIVYLYYANELKKNGKFEEAIKYYKKYKQMVPNDKRADIGIKSSKMSAKWIAHPTRYKVENMAIFNSRYEDFSPTFASKKYDMVIFSSNREGSKGNRTNRITGQGFTDLWYTKRDRKGKWGIPAPLPGDFVNTEDDEGASSVNRKGNTLYFTRCRVVKKKFVGCKIYASKKKGVTFADPVLIPIPGANDSVSIAHPSISPDDLTLYFAAELPGGYGGKDIWMMKREKKTKPWGEPINLGPQINTPGNEVFPYARSKNEIYFSSDYLPGMGGLDIFKAVRDENGKWRVENLKYPINSPSDDFGITFEGNKERGFFSSSRPGGIGSDDIYKFWLPPLKFTLSGYVKDQKTDDPIDSAKVVLKGSDGTTQEVLSEADGSFKFKLKPNTDYQIFVSKKDYLNGSASVSTVGIEEDKDFKQDVYLASVKKAIQLPNIFYDYAKATLRPESKAALDELVKTLNENPNIVIELSAHTDFRGNDEYNMKLSQARAESVVKYLISKGIDPDRLVAKGYGESKPRVVDKKTHKKYPFLPEGQALTPEFIMSLPTEDQQEVAHQLNRRTEFRVLRQDYVPKPKPANGVEPDNSTGENE